MGLRVPMLLPSLLSPLFPWLLSLFLTDLDTYLHSYCSQQPYGSMSPALVLLADVFEV